MNRELYQDLVLDHFRSPRCKHPLNAEDPDVFSLHNPNCGDIVRLRVSVGSEGRWTWEQDASGCAASVASSSILCEHLDGRDAADALALTGAFREALQAPLPPEGEVFPCLVAPVAGDVELEALLLFRSVPARQLCVSLAWTCAQNALAARSGAA